MPDSHLNTIGVSFPIVENACSLVVSRRAVIQSSWEMDSNANDQWARSVSEP